MDYYALQLPDFFNDLSLALVRLVLTITFIYEAKFKFKDLKGFAKGDGVPVPVAGFIATVEGLAALAMLTGFLADWAGLGIAILMIGTLQMHWFKWKTPYWANQKGWEYDILMFVLGLVIAAMGPGSWVLF